MKEVKGSIRGIDRIGEMADLKCLIQVRPMFVIILSEFDLDRPSLLGSLLQERCVLLEGVPGDIEGVMVGQNTQSLPRLDLLPQFDFQLLNFVGQRLRSIINQFLTAGISV